MAAHAAAMREVFMARYYGASMADSTPTPMTDADVQALIQEIRAEAAALRAETAKLVTDVPVPVHLRPELGYSSKRGIIGKAITLAKRVSEKMVHHVVEDAFDRVSQRLTRIDVMMDQQERRIAALEERLGATPDDRA